jgi:hypothetical protein
MHARLGSALLLLLLGTTSASAQTVDWATCGTSPAACTTSSAACCKETGTNLNIGTASVNKAIIIPMDRCHQTYANNDYPGAGAPNDSDNGGWCSNPIDTNVHGMFYAYGLIYRMMQQGIDVYWIINPTKTATTAVAYESESGQRYSRTDIDMWVLSSGATIPGAASALTDCPAASCTPPVRLLTGALAVDSTWTFSKKEFAIRGSAFLISGNDRAAFNTFWDKYGDGSPGAGRSCASNVDCYDFTQVNLYEVNAGATVAWRDHIAGSNISDSVPVAVKIDYAPPRIARVEPGGAVSSSWLAEANLDDKAGTNCETGAFSPSDAVWCELTEAQVLQNRLVTGNFGWAWMDGGSAFSSCGDVLKKMRTFITGVPGLYNAGNVMANDTKLDQIEKCTNYQLLGQQGAATSALGVSGTTVNEKKSPNYQPMLIRYPSNLFMQYGDIAIDFASSSVAHWTTDGTRKYNTIFTGASNTLKRLVSREAAAVAGNPICGDTNGDGDLADAGERAHSYDVWPHNTVGSCDVATSGGAGDAEDMMTYGRHENTALNGVVFYTAGNQLSNKKAELRMVLNSLLAVPSGGVTNTPTLSTEVARSTPVVPILNTGSGSFDAVVQGTTVYETPASSARIVNVDADVANFAFPYRMGHMRARRASDSTVVLDAGCNATVAGSFACPAGTAGIPSTANTYTGGCTFPKTSSNADCRTIFTSTARGDLRSTSLVYFNQNLPTAGKDLIKQGTNLADTSVLTIIQRVIAGFNISGVYYPRLGGVNRSTAAIIPPSTVAGSTSRPLMMYFGAEDGMIHAVCAEVKSAAGCDVLGRELWAYIPRTGLPYLRSNTAHIDSSPRVIDAKIDYDGTGPAIATWRTVLLFNSSFGDATADGRQPALYALDITDPTSPKVLWEYSMNTSSRGVVELGVGLNVAAGPVSNGGTTEYWVWAQTTNGGTDADIGSIVTAINIETGIKKWQFQYDYSPNPRTGTVDPIASSSIPGGVVPVDLTDSGKITDLTWTDLFGNLWMADPLTGTSRNGAGKPLFQISTGNRPIGVSPSIFKSGSAQYAVFSTGGYADPSNTTLPLECCRSTTSAGTCDAVQPTKPLTCAQYNNSTTSLPLQYAIAVKLNASYSSASASLAEPSSDCDSSTLLTPNLSACSDSNIMFRRTLGNDERGYTSPLIMGTQIFFTTDNQNVNSYEYTGAAASGPGRLYTFNTDGGSTSATPTVLSTGATGLGITNNASGTKSVIGATNTGTFFTTSTNGTTGPAVEKADTIGGLTSRKLWLRRE